MFLFVSPRLVLFKLQCHHLNCSTGSIVLLQNFAERILQNDTEYAQSFLTVISDKNSSKLLEASRAIWLRFWKENKLTNKKDDLIEVGLIFYYPVLRNLFFRRIPRNTCFFKSSIYQ